MIKLFGNFHDCCGCGACAAVCPMHIIAMKKNIEGFSFPTIINSKKCLKCKKCINICPEKNLSQVTNIREYYVAMSNNFENWVKSSSGGIFTELYNKFTKFDGYCFGAKWNGLEVIIDKAEGINATENFRKSKYIAANIDPFIYSEVKNLLDNSKKVVYSGTPCMINALKNYLNEDYDNLLTIDFACHGQGSSEIFKRWCHFLSVEEKSELIKFEFRTKKYIHDFLNSNCCTYTFLNGFQKTVTRDHYHHAYVMGLCMRESCHECKFASRRLSDITLADYKQQAKGLPEFTSKRNLSTIIANTNKGVNLINLLKKDKSVIFLKANKEFINKNNPKLYKSFPGNKKRDSFVNDVLIKNNNIKKCLNKYAPIMPSQYVSFNFSKRLQNFISQSLSIKILDKRISAIAIIDKIYKIAKVLKFI